MPHKTKVNFLSHIALVIFLFLAVLPISCSAPEKRLEKERLTIFYRSQFKLGREIKALRLKHPIKISQKQVMNHLFSLHYEELTLLGKKRYVFSSNDVLEITPLITKALNRMQANKVLYYEVDTSKGTTAGTILQAQGKIHWQFDTINGVSFDNSSFPGRKTSTWRLLPRNGQSFNKPSSMIGNEQQHNWIIANLDLPAKSKRSLKRHSPKNISSNSSPALVDKQPRSSSVNQNELKKRLRFLKELRNKKLIDDGEYKRKRKALLDQFL